MPTAVIFDIKRFAVHDGPGIRTTVFLKGCPLRCGWCHNPESHSMEPVTISIERKLNGRLLVADKTYGERVEVKALMEILLRDRHFYEESGGGVTFSGGEPLMQPGPLLALLKECRKRGIHTAVDTSGFAPRKDLDRIIPYTDLFLYDLKQMNENLHEKYTGAGNGVILSHADHLLHRKAAVIFRIPVIPGINTSPEERGRFVDYLAKRSHLLQEIHLLPYHRIAENKYKRLGMKPPLGKIKEPTPESVNEIKEQFETTGLKVRVGG